MVKKAVNACKIDAILLNPKQRETHLKELLTLDGLHMVEEDPNGVYCAVPLTGAAKAEQVMIKAEHEKIKAAVALADLKIYDPMESGMNPWVGIHDTPLTIYDGDTFQVSRARFFVLTNVFPTTGGGIEEQKAITFNKIPVVITKAGIYTSRMSTGARRVILIEYEDAERQRDEIAGVFKKLRDYQPGIGTCSVHGNTLLGFTASGAGPVCLPGLIEHDFPTLKYNFDKYRS